MSEAKRSKYLQQRLELIADLGDRCARCSRTDSLEFDCIFPAGNKHHGQSLYDRMRFYVRQHMLQNLQLLCTHCHELKSANDKRDWMARRMREVVHDTESGLRPVLDRGPEPSVSDWAAWCKWHAKKQVL